MKVKIFHIPALAPEAALEKLNKFLASNQVAEIQKNFVAEGPNSFWSIWVSTSDGQGPGLRPGRTKVDYREVKRFFSDFDARILALRQDILAGEVPYGRYREFRIFDPNPRKIRAACLRTGSFTMR